MYQNGEINAMVKAELKKASVNAIVVDLARTYAQVCLNYNDGKSTNRLDSHLRDICAELVKRGVLENGDAETFFK